MAKTSKTVGQILKAARIYGIDAFPAGAPMDHVQLGEILQVTGENFQRVKSCIEKSKDLKLHSTQDELHKFFSYNQIHFVLACMIRDLSLYGLTYTGSHLGILKLTK